MIDESKYDIFTDEIIKKIKNDINFSEGIISADVAYELIEEKIFDLNYDFSAETVTQLIKKIYFKLFCRLGPLEQFTADTEINEIMINGKDKLFYEKGSEIFQVDNPFETVEELEEIIRTIAADVHREINEMNPILDARLSDGSRVNAVMKNISAFGPVLTIRKFPRNRITIAEMITRNTLTEECANLLEILVLCGYNIFVSGGTSSGKTTFLNALSDYIPADERVIVIEDSSELNLSHINNLVQMECHNANTMGHGKISMDMLIKTSLRMRPDRIIVGEVRGKEVSDMLQAMNTGHDGSMSTGHGNSVSGMLRRLEAMYLMGKTIPIDAIRAQIIEGIDVIIHLGRINDGLRKVLTVTEIVDYKDDKYILNPIFSLGNDLVLHSTGNAIINKDKLIFNGYRWENEKF